MSGPAADAEGAALAAVAVVAAVAAVAVVVADAVVVVVAAAVTVAVADAVVVVVGLPGPPSLGRVHATSAMPAPKTRERRRMSASVREKATSNSLLTQARRLRLIAACPASSSSSLPCPIATA